MDPTTRKAALDQASVLLTTDPPAAEREARRILAPMPGDPNARLILGSALRRQGKTAEAVATLEALVAAFPQAYPSHYELGMALADAGRSERAITALQTAVQLQPEFPDAWRALGALMFDAGDARAADAAYDGYHLALVTDPRLRPAAVALYNGRQSDAEALLRPILVADPDDPVAADLMAEAYARLGRHSEAVVLLSRLLDRSPADDGARFRLARALHQQQRASDAMPHIDRLLAGEPNNPSYRNLLATALAQVGEFNRALTVYRDLLKTHDRHGPTWTNYAHALRMVGRSGDAAAAYARAIALDAGQGEAYLGLANLKTAAFGDDELAEMRRLSSHAEAPLEVRQQLAFALGKALEDRGDYEEAFIAYGAGAASRRAQSPWNAESFSNDVRRSMALFDAAFFAERAGFGASAPDPIFIVGLPRSGSTLVEQILASHSVVEGTAELPDIGFIANRLGDYPAAVAAVSAEQSKSLGEGYIASTQVQRRIGRPFFIDKMPNNFQFLGLIQLILPRAKIVDARRNPMATCFSTYKQHFAQGQAFSNDLEDLGRYYRDYVALMNHFDEVLPGRVHRVIYEDLVEDSEGEIRRLLAYCGLEFEPGCLAFHETQRPIRTVSSEQVRRPIYREGLDHWRNFEPWLDPLKAALGPALEGWR